MSDSHKQALIHILCCLFLVFGLSAQTLKYDVSVSGDEAGTSMVKRSAQGAAGYTIEVTTDLNIHMLLKIHLEFKGLAVFENDILQRSEVAVHNNGHRHSNTQVERNGSGYTIIKNEKSVAPPKGDIRLTGYNLYFAEPLGKEVVFSLSEGAQDRIKKVGKGKYEVTDSKNQKSTYEYNDSGQLKYLKLNHTIYDIEFFLKE